MPAREGATEMLEKLTVQNFRSIENCDVELGPITVFFGPTSAGKSTLFYSLLVLRNFIINPNQPIDGLFNLGFQNLGGFDTCVFNHNVSKTLGVTAHFADGGSYGVHFQRTEAEIFLKSRFLQMTAKVPIPYSANQSFAFAYTEGEEEFAINWNGFASTVSSKSKRSAVIMRSGFGLRSRMCRAYGTVS
jgi:predicted ATPase